MHLQPVAGNVDPARYPDIVFCQDMVEEFRDGERASRPSGNASVQANRHHAPAFRVKHDVVPGRYGSVWFTPREPGIYQGYCTEYCGTGHSKMNFYVQAIPADEFEEVIAQDARWIDDYSGDRLVWAGARLFAR